MLTLKVLFWAALAVVLYTYVGYGLVLFLMVRIKRALHGRPIEPVLPLEESLLPDVTLMICAYNEQDVIEEKMANIHQLDYPRQKLCVMWVTDGSTDNTNSLLARYDDVKLVFSPERRGKAAAMQHGLRENRSPLVVFTDANTMLNSDALREIVRQFMKPDVGCVSGEKRVAAKHGTTTDTDASDGDATQVAAEGEGFYWRYESALKRLDSELYSAMGAAGELFAVRMSDYREAPSNALLDDFMLSMLILKDGHRIAYTSQAYAVEYGSADMHEESKRKRRIAAGGLQSVWWLRSLMNPFTHPKVAFQFVSHRVLRWTLTPLCLVALIPLNAALIALGATWPYTVVALLQLLFYLAALAGYLLDRCGRKSRLLYVPYYFLFMNLNVFSGVAYLTTHRHSGTWEKARRS